jgi:predicted metal-dependent phosphoesterase TrpH
VTGLRFAFGLFAAAVVAGTAIDRATPAPPRLTDGYHVLAGDFHVHSFPFTWSTVSPCGTVLEARYRGLDVIAMTPHNQIWAGKMGRWCSDLLRGPMVLPGEEVTTSSYHLIAVGITSFVESGELSSVIDAVHAQGGVAIAAHPYEDVWPSYDANALEKLDGAEVVRPEAQNDERMAAQLRTFFGRAPLTAIGSTDYHGLGPLGYSRTYVFARERTERAVLDALREGRTVVYDREHVYGDPAMIRIAEQHGGLPRDVPRIPVPGAARAFSHLAAIVALLGALLFNRWGRAD